jgi:zinc protease
MLDSIKIERLSNGLMVLCLAKPGAPVVSAQVWYQTGSSAESAGIRGISHFLEHMMFRGSATVAPQQHSQKINDIGGHCNAFTSEDVTAYLNSVPVEYLDMVLAMEADRMQTLTLDEKLFETEKKVIVEEYHTYLNNPVTRAFLEFRSVFFEGHPYAVGPLGTLEDISALTPADCRRYYDRWYAPANAVLVVVGDIGATERVIDRCEHHFGAMRGRSGNSGAERTSSAFVPRVRDIRWMKRKVDFDIPILLMGYPAPASAHNDALPLEILQMIMSQGESSRIHRAVVRRRSLAVMAGGMNHLLRQTGMSLFFALFTPDVAVSRLAAALLAEIERIRTEGISEQEMDKIRATALTMRAAEMYSAEHICHRLGYAQAVEGDCRLWIERLKTLERLSRAEVIAAADKYWNPQERLTMHLQPKKVKPLLFIAGILRRFLPKNQGA